MSLEEQLRAAADSLVSNTAGGETIIRPRPEPGPMDYLAALSQLGVAAYTLGVHYLVQDRIRSAEHWLRIAAELDVGDAALRLAYLYELLAVQAHNADPSGETGGPEIADRYQSESARWFDEAREAGYATDGPEAMGRLELPFESLEECCPETIEAAARRHARQITDAAQTEATRIVRAASADVRAVVHGVRQRTWDEVATLERERDRLTDEVVQLRGAFRELAAQLPRAHAAAAPQPEAATARRPRWRDRMRRGLPFRRHVTLYWPEGTPAEYRVRHPHAVLGILASFPAAYSVVMTAPPATSRRQR
jgi:hypothetical protein